MLTTYEYDDAGRMVRSWQQSEWTEEDRALMLARDVHLKSLCRCGHQKEQAWHPGNEGWYEVTAVYECHACTALARHEDSDAAPVRYLGLTDTRDYEKNPLSPMPVGPRMDPAELARAIGDA